MTIVGWSAIVGPNAGEKELSCRITKAELEVATVAIYLPFAFNESDEWPFEVSALLAEITLSMRQLHKQLKDIVVLVVVVVVVVVVIGEKERGPLCWSKSWFLLVMAIK